MELSRWRHLPAMGKAGKRKEDEGTPRRAPRGAGSSRHSSGRGPSLATNSVPIPPEPSSLARPSGERRRRSGGMAIPLVSQSAHGGSAYMASPARSRLAHQVRLARSIIVDCASGRDPPGPRPAPSAQRSMRVTAGLGRAALLGLHDSTRSRSRGARNTRPRTSPSSSRSGEHWTAAQKLRPDGNICAQIVAHIRQTSEQQLKSHGKFQRRRFARSADVPQRPVVVGFGVRLTPVLYLDVRKYRSDLPAILIASGCRLAPPERLRVTCRAAYNSAIVFSSAG